MAKFGRLQELHRILQSRRYPVSEQTLADELGCTVRTVQRYLQELRDNCHAPLVKEDQPERGWRYDDPNNEFQLAGLWFTNAELTSLASLLQIIDQLDSSLLQEQLNSIERRVEDLLNSRGINAEQLKAAIKMLPHHKPPTNSPILCTINDALLNDHRLRIRYQSYNGQRSKRDISPQQLVYYQDSWYLDAWCHLRQALRQFKLARIQSAEPLDEPNRHCPSEQLTNHFASAYGIFGGPAQHTADLIFTGDAARDVALQHWHPDQTGHWHDNHYHLTIPYNNDTELIRDLLAFGDQVTINAPSKLKRKLLRKAKNIVTNYDPGWGGGKF